MIAEVIIKDSMWQETVQTFTEFLFKSDLLTDTQKHIIQLSGKKTLISIDESTLNVESIFKSQSIEEVKAKEISICINEIHENIIVYSNQARSAINYYQCTNILIKKAIEDAKDKSFSSEHANPSSGFGEVVAEVAHEFEDDENDNDNFGQTHSIEPEHPSQDNKGDLNKVNKYWNKVQKSVLFNYAFMIAPANGVLIQYLDHHGTDYSNKVSNSFNSESLASKESKKNHISTDTFTVPISFLLTTTVLKFCETLFTSADKTLYNRIFTDELVLSFIRTHWICFVRLYNRSFQSASLETANPFSAGFNSKFNEDEIESINSITPKIALLTLYFCVREIDLEYEESVENEERGQRELFSVNSKYDIFKNKEENPVALREVASYPCSVNSNYEASAKKVLESPDINQDQIKPLVGFNLSLDLSKVAKGAKPKDKILVEEAKAPQFDHDFALRSSLGNNSEMAHPIDVSYKANDAHVPSDSSSSSDDYDFVPPPELNPNLYYPERKQQPVVGKVGLSLGGLNFKLNLTNVPTAHIITDEDKSRIQALKESKPDTFSNTVNLKLSEENPSKENLKFDGSSTTTKAITAPKLPAFGGGFKLDLTKVPTAHVITDEDKQKCKANKDIPLIAKNNFTDSKEIKGSRPKKLNVKGKDSTTKITNDISFPDLKAAKGIEDSIPDQKKRKFKKKFNPDKEKESRNINVSKMKSLVIENSEASSLLESNTDDDEYKMPLYKRKVNEKPSNAEIVIRAKNLTPNVGNVNLSNSQISKGSDNSRSDISNGSYVGSNRVFIPFLNIQEDVINKEVENKKKRDEEIKNKREVDKNNPRFQMKRMSNEKKDLKNLAKAKNDRMLNINLKSNDTNPASTENININSSKEIILDPSQDVKPNPFSLNLSKVQTKGEAPKVRDNSFFENNNEKESWDIKAISESEHRTLNKDATVTLGATNGVDKLNSKFSIKLPKNIVQSETQNIIIVNQNEVYNKERFIRGIYHDDELHSLIIYLIFCLILTPQRGTLDDLYCSRYPLMDGKPPVLHFLHFHLNHSANQSLIPLILKKVEKQFVQNSGVRLLKLLCTSMFDKSLYQDRSLIAKGAYGIVYQCKTLCEDPEVVAIKQTNFPHTIENRCALYDVFTEVHIASFDAFRDKSSVVDIYDYGVDATGYHLIMKRYRHSLKEWRVSQSKSLKDNLSLYLSLYKDILKAVELFHSNNVTHYDIKADNIFLDVTDNEKQISDSNLTVALGDLGECKMFISEEDEFCEKNRGTEVIMSPEMLMLAINIRKNTEKYDRRK